MVRAECDFVRVPGGADGLVVPDTFYDVLPDSINQYLR